MLIIALNLTLLDGYFFFYMGILVEFWMFKHNWTLLKILVDFQILAHFDLVSNRVQLELQRKNFAKLGLLLKKE